MHSSSTGAFTHGPRWFRHWGPKLIPLLTLLTLVVILVGVFFPGASASHAPEQKDTASAAVAATGHGPEGVCEKVYTVVRLFLFHAEPEKGHHLQGWFQQAGALLAVLTTVSVGLGLLFVTWDHLRLWGLSIPLGKRHVVICGLGERLGLPLALAYRSGKLGERRRVVAIEKNPDDPLKKHAVEALRDAGVIVLAGDATEHELLEEAHVHRAERVFAVTGSDVDNVEISLNAKTGSTGGPHCHVHLGKPDQAELLADGLRRSLGQASTEVFSLNQITARHLLHRLFAEQAPCADQALHIVLLGFGEMGQALACELAAQAHLVNHRRLRLTICDQDIETKRVRFLKRFPAFCPEPQATSPSGESSPSNDEAESWASSALRPAPAARGVDDGGIEYVCHAEFRSLPHGGTTPSFLNGLASCIRPGDLTVIVACQEEERANVLTGLRVREDLQTTGPLTCWVWLQRTWRLADVFAGTAASAVRLVPFGTPKELVASREMFLFPFEQTARQFHEAFRQQRKAEGKDDPTDPAMREWDQLSQALRQSNRARAFNLEVKVQALAAHSLKLMPLPEAAPEEVVSVFTKDEIEVLAEMEHNRWVAERLMGGWRYARKTDKPAKLHADLIPYKQLPEGTKAYDRTSAGELLTHLAGSGRCLVRKSASKT